MLRFLTAGESHGEALVGILEGFPKGVKISKDFIDRELKRLLPVIRDGGFLPALDDVVSHDMPFSHFRYLIEALQAISLDH